jgi:mono/diheme cytochrome c family protein
MNQRLPVLLSFAFAVAVSSLAASPPDLSKLPPPAKQEGVTYTKDIHPIFEASCFRCHGSERPKGGLRLDSLEGALKGSKEGKVIVPGQSTKSPLVLAVARLDENNAMPPKQKEGRPRQGQKAPSGPPPKPLTPEQVGLVRAWVDQGAK